jgi:hypothetical protein
MVRYAHDVVYRGQHSPKWFQGWNFYRAVGLTTQEPSVVPVFHMTAASGWLVPDPQPLLADPAPLFLRCPDYRRGTAIKRQASTFNS